MEAVRLAISGQGRTWDVELRPGGMTIGRSEACDLVIRNKDISRQHAIIFPDPFGRWIIQDLGSSNGTFIHTERVETSAIPFGEPVTIGEFSLLIVPSLEPQSEASGSVRATATATTNGFETEMVSGKGMQDRNLSPRQSKQLDDIIERLSRLTSLSMLYPELCRSLAALPGEIAMVLRLPRKSEPLPKSPEVLSCHFADDADGATSSDTGVFKEYRLAFRLSAKMLEAARSTGDAVMVKSIFTSDSDVSVTRSASDEHAPRAIICVPLGDVTHQFDLLYLDIPVDDAKPNILPFIEAVARQAVITRQSLVLMQAKAERSVLDYQLSLARQIQMQLIPTVPQGLSDLDIDVYYKPTIWVGGDYGDIWKTPDGRLGFVLGKTSQAGLPGAIAMQCLGAVLRTVAAVHSDPAEVLRHANAHLNRTQSDNVAMSLFLGFYTPEKGELEYANAGGIQPVVIEPRSTDMLPVQPSSPIPVVDSSALQTRTHTFQKDFCLVAFTEGITNLLAPGGGQSSIKALVRALKTVDQLSANKIVAAVIDSIASARQMMGQDDDLTLFALVHREV